MHKISKLVVFFFFCFCFFFSRAQNKYAVIVAVNDYFSAPGQRHPLSLAGCINDGESVKELLTDRFGFASNNIHTLYNAAATKKNLIDLLSSILYSCKPGDAVVFYYSGHGVWMTNKELGQDAVKRGMSQAIVMSDLYSPGWDCLVRDETLKDMFNKYVNKQVVVTTIFDCCFSANLMMMPHARYWVPGFGNGAMTKKDMDPDEIPYIPDSTGIYMDPVAFIEAPDNYFNPDSFGTDTSAGQKSFDLKSALQASNRSSLRPTERSNSKVLSLSATLDIEKGLEITDLSGSRHGAFTAALIEVYKSNSPTLPVYDLLNKLTAAIKRQHYPQSPSFNYDPARLNGNLIGIPASDFSEKLKAVCVLGKNGSITINKGTRAGVAKGNIFSTANAAIKRNVEVTKVFADSAIAIDKSNKIKPGDILELTDDYTVTKPIKKIFIPSVSFTQATFAAFFKNKIMPLVKKKDYGDYNYSSDEFKKTVMIWQDANKFQKTEGKYFTNPDKSLVYVLLPVPSFLSDQLKKSLGKNQSLEIVKDPSKADYVLYLNYARDTINDPNEAVFEDPGFKLYFHPLVKGDINMAMDFFTDDHVTVPNLDQKNIATINSELSKILIKWIRLKTKDWLNTYPRR